MRVLWYNWRDIKNPEAGGAEVFTHETMRRLVRKGYDMTLFTSQIANCPTHETIEGIKIIRSGSKYTVYRKARQHFEVYKDSYDLVIDENNTKPFLTPKFVKEKPILALFHSLAREAWFYEVPFPLNYIGYYYLEKKWLSYYKEVPSIAVSNSTKEDLERLGFKKVFLVPEGLSVTPLADVLEKESNPTIVFIGRLKRHKLPHHAIEAFSMIKKEIPDAKMWVIGEGKMREELERIKVNSVIFYGYVENLMKYKMLSKAHLVLVTGVREGWGLVVLESNAMGTPAVAYNIPGLRDSVKDGQTGILVKENSPSGLAYSAISLLRNHDFLTQISRNALGFSKQFDWDNTADEFDKIIKIII